jgi:hypothetical protein
MKFERVERLRFHADQAVGDPGYRNSVLAEMAEGDAGALQTAWAGFVPMLAHPVMAAQARGAMQLLDSAVAMATRYEPAVA